MKDFWKKNKKWILVVIGILAALAAVYAYLKARKDHIGVSYWTGQIAKLKTYLTVTDFDNWSFNGVPESLSSMVDWANTNYPNLREANETMDVWLDRQIKFANDNEPFLAKLLF